MDITEAAALMSARESEVAVVEPHDNGTVIEMVDGTAYIDVADETPDADGKTGLMYLRTPAVKGFIPVFPVFAYETESAVEPVPASETAPADPNGSPPAGETAPATSDADAADPTRPPVETAPASETAPADPNGSPPAGETAPATSDADAAPAARKGK